MVGRGEEPAHPHLAARALHRHEVRGGLAPHRRRHPVGQPGARRRAQRHPARRAQREAHRREGQGQPEQRLAAVARLAGRGPHELAAGRGVEEEVAHLHRGAARARHRPLLHQPSALHHEARPRLALGPVAGVEAQPRHRGDGRQGLAAEAQVAMVASPAASASLEVAWRSSAMTASSAFMPQPSSATRTRASPPSSISTDTWRAPASSAFSTSSFSADAGRSTTSPAAIWLTRPGGRRRTVGIAGF